jgi:hypothetical protein
VIEPQARFFCKNRGVSLLVRKGNPLGIQGLAEPTDYFEVQMPFNRLCRR